MEKEQKQGKTLLLCSPASDPLATPGSVVLTAECGHQVWVSVSGQKKLDEDPMVEMRCTDCFEPASDDSMESVAGAAEEIKAMLTPEQYAEIRIEAKRKLGVDLPE